MHLGREYNNGVLFLLAEVAAKEKAVALAAVFPARYITVNYAFMPICCKQTGTIFLINFLDRGELV